MGRATISLLLTSRGSFRVATTVPTTRARISLWSWKLGLRARVGLSDRQRVFEIGVRTRDHVNGDEFTHATGGGGTGIGGSFDRGDVAAHDRGHVAGANLLPPDERDLRRF